MATYFDITMLPRFSIAGFRHRFRVTARNLDGTTDATFGDAAGANAVVSMIIGRFLSSS